MSVGPGSPCVNMRAIIFDMTQFAEMVSRSVMGRVTEARKKAGLSGAALAQACTEAGLPMPRNVVANLESGRRTTLTVAELATFAHVLDVPLVELLYGVDSLSDASPLALPAGAAIPTADLITEAVDDVGLRAQDDVLSPLRALRRLNEAERDLVRSARNNMAGELSQYGLPEAERVGLEWVAQMQLKGPAREVARLRFVFLHAGRQAPPMRPEVRQAMEQAGGARVLAFLAEEIIPGDAGQRDQLEELVAEAFEPAVPAGGASGQIINGRVYPADYIPPER